MNIKQLILPSLALCVGGLCVLPSMEEAQAWSLLGTKLNQNQRDFRIFNNFTDSSANNNNVPDSQFPGHQGVVMAIWKGAVEWGSRAHGDGSGDPTQGTLGSGGANFDAHFQGLATVVGDGNDKIQSEIGGSSGGVLAYTEGNGGQGWRIRYYRSWSWEDGPGAPGGGIDIQGVACHEYGHALGLGHTSASGATMRPSISGTGSGQRSINSDDIAGIQANYGAADPLKPIISSVNVVGSTIQINGSGFDAIENQIWFTPSFAQASGGTPVKVTGLTSNGTFLSATIPTGAGPGDILVRRDGIGNMALSNAMPIDLIGPPPCSTPTNYCTFLPNSAGPGATISSFNSPSLSDNNFNLTAGSLPPNKVGLFFYGPNQANNAFGDGRLCIGGSITRLPAQVSDLFGLVDLTVDFNSSPFNAGNGQAVVNGTMNFQFWYRDPGFGSAGFNTTDGLSVTFCP